MNYSINFDETELQQGFTTKSLLLIESLLGREIAELLYGEVFPVDVELIRKPV